MTYYSQPRIDVVSMKYKPHVILKFIEDPKDVEAGYRQVYGQISFRLMQYDSFYDEDNPENLELSLNLKAKLIEISTKIDQKFASPLFEWKKGKTYFSYIDKPKGYELKLLALDEIEAKRIIENVLDLQSHSPDWEKLRISKASDSEIHKAFPVLPDQKYILGKKRRLGRERPIATVTFQEAVVDVFGLPNLLKLYPLDKSLRDTSPPPASP